ncbi:MAG: LptF/LptG family permease [Armatimonadetes bacterium]|nr:LptF/LptG family permease [Armatimonadota bacterium]
MLDRYILSEHLPPFLFGVAAFVSLMMASQYLFELTKLMVKGMPFAIAFKLFVLYMPSLIVLTFPMSMLFSTLWAFGRLSGESEMITMFAGGISLYRIIGPVMGMGVMVSMGAIAINEFVVPAATDAAALLKRQAAGVPLRTDKPFLIEDMEEGKPLQLLYVAEGFDLEQKLMRGVTMVRFSPDREKTVPIATLYAEKIVYRGRYDWRTEGAVQIQPIGDHQPWITTRDAIAIRLKKTPEDIASERKNPVDMSFRELRGYIARLMRQGADTAELEVKLQDKLSIPFASLVFVLIGAPLGIRPQRSSSARGFGYSVLIIFAYYVVWHYMSILGQGGTVSPSVASWTPNIVGLVAGAGLLVKTAR